MSPVSLSKNLGELQKVQEEKVTSDRGQVTLQTSDKRPVAVKEKREKTFLLGTEAVFAVNFLRSELLPQVVRRLLASLAVVYLLANVVFLFVLFESAGKSRAEWRSLQAQIPSADSLNALHRELGQMQEQALKDIDQIGKVVAFKKERFPSGGKLASLAKTIPSRTWITSLSGDRTKRQLSIEATFLIDPSSPYELPMQSWMQALKSDPQFGKGLKGITLENSSQKMQGASELCFFRLTAEWQ